MKSLALSVTELDGNAELEMDLAANSLQKMTWSANDQTSGEFPTWLYQQNVSLLSTVPAGLVPMVPPHWYQYPAPQPAWHLAIGTIYVIIGLLAALGNVASLLVLTCSATARGRSSPLLASLAVSDLGMVVTQIPLLAVNSFGHRWVAPPWTCQVCGFCGGLFGTASILSLAVIASERSRVLNRKSGCCERLQTTSNYIIFVWVFSAVWMGLPFVHVSRFVAEGFMTSCTFDFLSSDTTSRVYIGLSIVFCYLLPLYVIVSSYCSIYKTLNYLPTIGLHGREGIPIKTVRESLVRRRELRLAGTIMMLVTAWCLAWTPYTVSVVLGMVGSRRLTPFVSVMSATFAKSSAVYNPIIYGLAQHSFRKDLRGLLQQWTKSWFPDHLKKTTGSHGASTVEMSSIRRASVVIRRGRVFRTSQLSERRSSQPQLHVFSTTTRQSSETFL